MKKSIKNILLALLLAAIIPIIFLLIIFYKMDINIIEEIKNDINSNFSKFENETIINIGDNGIIEVEETIKMKLGKTQSSIPNLSLSLYSESHELDKNEMKGAFDKKVIFDGEEMESLYYKFNKNDVKLINYNVYDKKEHVIKINYKYNTDECIKDYSNVTCINILNDTKYKKHKLKIVLPKSTSTFILKESNSSEEIRNISKKVNDRTYEINLSDYYFYPIDYMDVLVDKGIINGAEMVYEKMLMPTSLDYKSERVDELSNFALLFIVLDIIGIIIILMAEKKNKVEKEYIKDTEMVIEPVLAEAIIDRKVGAKELIMSTVARLVNRGNLECIDNDKIKLINYDNISSYEKRILNLLFENDKTIISFEEIKQIFKTSNEKTSSFYSFFKNIKKDIEQELIDKEIYTASGDLLMKFIRIAATVIYANCITLIITIAHGGYLFPHYILYANVIGLIVGLIKEGIKVKIVSDLKENYSFILIKKIFSFNVAFIIVGIIFLLIAFNDWHRVFIVAIIWIILNTILYKKAHTHIFTEKGKEEYKKAYGLKSYIKDYSLMKERELESNILWDDYLTYAIAFGISNNVTKRLGEEWMNANIALQTIEKILKF